MKKIFIIITGLFILFSCDKRKNYYYLENQSDGFSVSYNLLDSHSSETAVRDKVSFIDTAKIGFDYHFRIKIKKLEKSVRMKYSGNILLKVNNDDYVDEIDINTNTWINMSLVPFNEGPHELNIVFEDSYGKTKELNIKLFVFNNRSPVISDWILYTVGDLSPLHKRIILTANDPDEIYGGGISYYQFIINGDTTNYPGHEMDYIFPAEDYYDFGIRCKDNNGAWSNFIQVSNYFVDE